MTEPASTSVERAVAELKADGRVIAFPGGRMQAVTSVTPSVVGLLAAWRRANAEAFTTRFPVTEEATAAWLQAQVIENPHRVLFLLSDDTGRPVGNLGFMAGDAVGLPVEIDNVLRGEPTPDGFMERALLTLLDWLAAHVSPDPVGLRVLASNPRAVRFYGKCGFGEAARIALTEQRDGDRVSLVPGDANVVDEYVTMTRDPRVSRTNDVESP